mgnify:CR=1 FL=1
MKLAIVTACPNGMVTSVLCARLLDAAAQRQGWSTSVEVVDVQRPERQLSQATIDDAEWVLLVSSTPVAMQRFVGKRVFQSTPAQARADVEAVLRRGAEEAVVYVAPEGAAKNAPRIVAVTACPTGVAHTFMAAEALQQTAKRLGYDLQVETQGSVGARTPLSPEAIANADVVLLCLGENSYTEKPGDMNDLYMSDLQTELAQKIAATGKTVILILNEGRPRVISKFEQQMQGIVQTYLPGNFGGDALADILQLPPLQV